MSLVLPSSIKMCFDKWTPIKFAGKGMQGSVWVVCDSVSCDYVAKFYTGVISNENELEFHKIASDLNIAPKFVDYIDCKIRGRDSVGIVMERYSGDLSHVLRNEKMITRGQMKAIVHQSFELIYKLLQHDIDNNEYKICSLELIRIS